MQWTLRLCQNGPSPPVQYFASTHAFREAGALLQMRVSLLHRATMWECGTLQPLSTMQTSHTLYNETTFERPYLYGNLQMRA